MLRRMQRPLAALLERLLESPNLQSVMMMMEGQHVILKGKGHVTVNGWLDEELRRLMKRMDHCEEQLSSSPRRAMQQAGGMWHAVSLQSLYLAWMGGSK